MEYQILLDRDATKSYMSKSYYLQCKTLHALPKFSSNTQKIQVGNGQYVSVLFVIPVIINIHRHRFEIFTLVSKIHDNVELVMGMKNICKLEGIVDLRDSCFSFLSRSIPFFPVMTVEIASKLQKMVIVEAPFIEELSGMAMVKILDIQEQTTNMIKLKFIRNKVVLKITNKTHKTNFWKNRNDRNCRFKITRFLQNKARGTSGTFRQTLSLQTSRRCMSSVQYVQKSYEKRGRKFRRKIPLVRRHQ